MSATTIRTPEQCAQAQLDAYNARNIDAFAEVYTDDVQLIDLASGEVFCDGQGALVDRYGPMFDSHPDLNCKLVSRIVCGDFVYDEEHVTGLQENTIVHAVATYQVANGKIMKAWFARERAGA